MIQIDLANKTKRRRRTINWVIRKLAGKRTIILNADLTLGAPIRLKPGDMVCDTIARTPRTIDVRAFGAKGDGETDNSEAIQSALDASRSWSREFPWSPLV